MEIFGPKQTINGTNPASQPLETKTPQERRREHLAAMKKTLYDAICDTCASMMKNSRERLHQQYKRWSERRDLRK